LYLPGFENTHFLAQRTVGRRFFLLLDTGCPGCGSPYLRFHSHGRHSTLVIHLRIHGSILLDFKYMRLGSNLQTLTIIVRQAMKHQQARRLSHQVTLTSIIIRFVMPVFPYQETGKSITIISISSEPGSAWIPACPADYHALKTMAVCVVNRSVSSANHTAIACQFNPPFIVEISKKVGEYIVIEMDATAANGKSDP
jgi:hypothetical protein